MKEPFTSDFGRVSPEVYKQILGEETSALSFLDSFANDAQAFTDEPHLITLLRVLADSAWVGRTFRAVIQFIAMGRCRVRLGRRFDDEVTVFKRLELAASFVEIVKKAEAMTRDGKLLPLAIVPTRREKELILEAVSSPTNSILPADIEALQKRMLKSFRPPPAAAVPAVDPFEPEPATVPKEVDRGLIARATPNASFEAPKSSRTSTQLYDGESFLPESPSGRLTLPTPVQAKDLAAAASDEKPASTTKIAPIASSLFASTSTDDDDWDP